MRKQDKPKKAKSRLSPAVAMCLGIAIGAGIGAAMDDIGLGLLFGVCVGLCGGAAVGAYAEKPKDGEKRGRPNARTVFADYRPSGFSRQIKARLAKSLAFVYASTTHTCPKPIVFIHMRTGSYSFKRMGIQSSKGVPI